MCLHEGGPEAEIAMPEACTAEALAQPVGGRDTMGIAVEAVDECGAPIEKPLRDHPFSRTEVENRLTMTAFHDPVETAKPLLDRPFAVEPALGSPRVMHPVDRLHEPQELRGIAFPGKLDDASSGAVRESPGEVRIEADAVDRGPDRVGFRFLDHQRRPV